MLMKVLCQIVDQSIDGYPYALVAIFVSCVLSVIGSAVFFQLLHCDFPHVAGVNHFCSNSNNRRRVIGVWLVFMWAFDFIVFRRVSVVRSWRLLSAHCRDDLFVLEWLTDWLCVCCLWLFVIVFVLYCVCVCIVFVFVLYCVCVCFVLCLCLFCIVFVFVVCVLFGLFWLLRCLFVGNVFS